MKNEHFASSKKDELTSRSIWMVYHSLKGINFHGILLYNKYQKMQFFLLDLLPHNYIIFNNFKSKVDLDWEKVKFQNRKREKLDFKNLTCLLSQVLSLTHEERQNFEKCLSVSKSYSWVGVNGCIWIIASTPWYRVFSYWNSVIE